MPKVRTARWVVKMPGGLAAARPGNVVIFAVNAIQRSVNGA
jgi:hypothetical protein